MTEINMSENLKQLSYAELVELNRQAEILINEQRNEALKSVVEKVMELAEANKLPIEDVVGKLVEAVPGSVKRTRKSSNVEPRFAHPENPSLTWTGRGRAPRWVLDYIGSDRLDRHNAEHQSKMQEIAI